MRRPPPISDFIKYPVVGGTIALAIAVTLAKWSKNENIDISVLFESGEIRRGQLWRLVTSVLPHNSPMHLLFNVYWTWVFGTLIEETFGHLKTFAIFVLFAVASGGAEFAILSGGVGLSGIGYGLFGLLWALSRRDRRFFQVIDQNTIVLFVIWFFVCIALTLAGSPVANIAHGVGAVTGIMLGLAIADSSRLRWLRWGALAVLVAAILAGATVARPWINLSEDRGVDEGQFAYDALMADRNEEALRWSRDAVRMQPKNAEYWFNMGLAYARLNRKAEATAAFGRARELDPEHGGAEPDAPTARDSTK